MGSSTIEIEQREATQIQGGGGGALASCSPWLSVENSGEHLGRRGSVPNPDRGLIALTQTP